jgi:NAD(P)H-hydrate epimerase
MYGKVLVIAGSRTMIGAPALTANAALRAGAGLVQVATPTSVHVSVAVITPCATSLPLPEDAQGQLATVALREILPILPNYQAIALGPGLGKSQQLQTLVTQILTEAAAPVIIDADGLNNLAQGARGQGLKLPSSTILTPHPGEFGRLWGAVSRKPMPDNRLEQAATLSRACGAIVVLKGHETVVTDGARTYVNTTGNAGLATGGAGDVLTGIIAALAARQGGGEAKSSSDKDLGARDLSPFDAAVLGTYIHGLAGDLAAQVLGQTALMAWDLLDYLPQAWQQYERTTAR